MAQDPPLDPRRWVDQHGDALYRFAMLRLRDPEVAAEVVQETFLEALRARESFSGRSSERTWLVGILKHKVIDHYRKGRREAPAGDAEAIERAVESPFDRKGFWRAPPRPWGTEPGRELEGREFREVFERCLSRLPPHFAEAFALRELDEIPGEEICQILGITSTNLWARLHRARLLLRRCLEIHWFGGGDPRT